MGSVGDTEERETPTVSSSDLVRLGPKRHTRQGRDRRKGTRFSTRYGLLRHPAPTPRAPLRVNPSTGAPTRLSVSLTRSAASIDVLPARATSNTPSACRTSGTASPLKSIAGVSTIRMSHSAFAYWMTFSRSLVRQDCGRTFARGSSSDQGDMRGLRRVTDPPESRQPVPVEDRIDDTGCRRCVEVPMDGGGPQIRRHHDHVLALFAEGGGQVRGDHALAFRADRARDREHAGFRDRAVSIALRWHRASLLERVEGRGGKQAECIGPTRGRPIHDGETARLPNPRDLREERVRERILGDPPGGDLPIEPLQNEHQPHPPEQPHDGTDQDAT